jgi:hypothetical protein
VHSTTGELAWDYSRGLVTIDAPAAQGATGFLAKRGTIELTDLAITSPIQYGSILLVSMDGRPIASSQRMLLQVMSEDNNTGWSAPGKGVRPIVEVGGPPIVVKEFSGTVSLRGREAPALSVQALDFNGYPSRTEASSKRARDITLLPTTLYYPIGGDSWKYRPLRARDRAT